MSEAKYTNGPWKWATSNSWKRMLSMADASLPMPVLVPFRATDGHPDLQVGEADMKLIEAAPDLYKNLKACIEVIERVERDMGTKLNTPVLANAKAAIKKATP